MRMLKTGSRLLLLLAIAAFSFACAPLGYYWDVSTGQLSILLNRVPIQKAVNDDGLDETERRKLALVQHVKTFGAEALGLEGGRSYETFVKLDRPYATLVLTAAPPDALDAYRWKFPIVGSVAYKGFFSRDRAKRERDMMAEEGYDVYLRPAAAFSTLGWFEDPILSPMLRMDESNLVDTIIHEMTHATLYFAGHTEFNETVATFVGNQGAVEYLARMYGSDSTQVARVAYELEDQQAFAQFIEGVIAGLRSIYAEPVEKAEKLARKLSFVETEKERFASEVTSTFHRPDYYAGFAQREWNNASLLARSAYLGDLTLFARLYRKRGEPLRDFVQYLKTWEDDPDPQERLRREAGDAPTIAVDEPMVSDGSLIKTKIQAER